MEIEKIEGEQQPVQVASELNDRLGAAERLFVRLMLENHEDEANALMLIDALMLGMLAPDEPLTECAQELRDELFEVVESWLPKNLVIVDKETSDR